MRTHAEFKANGWADTVTIVMPRVLVDALAAASVHRDEGPSVVVIKCAGFEDAEDLSTMFIGAQRFIEESRRGEE